MRVDLRYQISFFGEYSDITPSPEFIKSLTDNLSSYSFVPQQLSETQITPNGLLTTKRLKLSTIDSSRTIEFKSDRIDFYFVNADINVFNMISIDAFTKQVKQIYKSIDQIIHKLVRRVGFVRTVLFLDDVNPQDVYHRLNTNIKFYDSLKMKDWSNYVPAEVELNSGLKVNAVSTIQHFTNNLKIDSIIQLKDGVLLMTDVNTLPELFELRYDYNAIDSLLDELQKVEYKLCNQFTELIQDTKK